MKFILFSTALLSTLSLIAIAHPTKVAETQPVTIRFAAKVGTQPLACGSTYRLGNPSVELTLEDFRFYVSDVALLDAVGKTVPLTLEQDGKWQYQTVALLDFENKTGACRNGTAEMRNYIVGTVPNGNYTGLKFSLGVPFALNHADSTLAPSPLNLTGLWWNWQLGYKFARLDLQNPGTKPSQSHSPKQHSNPAASTSGGFPIHLGSTGCQVQPPAQQPTNCTNPNRASITFSTFNSVQNTIIGDLAQLVANTNLSQNQAKTAPGCMSEPEDQDCLGIMTRLGLSFGGNPATTQTFFQVQ
jgi:uncharacterized repeat protein (TIGR04052 family)